MQITSSSKKLHEYNQETLDADAGGLTDRTAQASNFYRQQLGGPEPHSGEKGKTMKFTNDPFSATSRLRKTKVKPQLTPSKRTPSSQVKPHIKKRAGRISANLSLSPHEKSFNLKGISRMLDHYKENGQVRQQKAVPKHKQRLLERRKSANAIALKRSPGRLSRDLSPSLNAHPVRGKSKEAANLNAIYKAIADKVKVLETMGNKLFEKDRRLKQARKELTRDKELFSQQKSELVEKEEDLEKYKEIITRQRNDEKRRSR